jgi:hypothetical protein
MGLMISKRKSKREKKAVRKEQAMTDPKCLMICSFKGKR